MSPSANSLKRRPVTELELATAADTAAAAASPINGATPTSLLPATWTARLSTEPSTDDNGSVGIVSMASAILDGAPESPSAGSSAQSMASEERVRPARCAARRRREEAETWRRGEHGAERDWFIQGVSGAASVDARPRSTEQDGSESLLLLMSAPPLSPASWPH